MGSITSYCSREDPVDTCRPDSGNRANSRNRNYLSLRVHPKRYFDTLKHSRPQRPRSFWSAPRIATSGHVQHRKSAIHGLPVTLRMFRVKSDKSDWFWSQSIVFSKPFKNGMSLDRARGRDSWCWPKGARPLGTRMTLKLISSPYCALSRVCFGFLFCFM